MPQFDMIDVALRGRVADCAFSLQEPVENGRERLLNGLGDLIDWLEDEAGCDIVLLRANAQAPAVVGGFAPDLEGSRRWEKVLLRLESIPCVSVAVVDGSCHGMWMQLALACDHRLATSHSTFQVVELKDGYLPGMNVFRLAKYAGIGVARRLIFTGMPIEAESAKALGLVDEVCESGDADHALSNFIEELQPINSVPAQLARRLLNESFSSAFEGFIGQYLASQHRCLQLREGKRAQEGA